MSHTLNTVISKLSGSYSKSGLCTYLGILAYYQRFVKEKKIKKYAKYETYEIYKKYDHISRKTNVRMFIALTLD